MKLRTVCLACALCLLMPLAACTPKVVAEPTSTPTQTPTPQPTPLAVTKESIPALFQDYQIREILPYEGDFLVYYGTQYPPGSLSWVYGATGETVRLTNGEGQQIDSYEIQGPGQVLVRTNGIGSNTPWQGLPMTFTCQVSTAGNESLSGMWKEEPWFPLDRALYLGFVDEETKQPLKTSRYEQVYDARVTVDGVSLSFIPSGDPERYGSFFPACTTTPNMDCSFDPDKSVFTMRLYNTALESGGIAIEEVNEPYQGLYPYRFPAGSLGEDNHFFTDAAIVQDGEDTVVTLTLTENAKVYTVTSGNLGGDSIPCLSVSFRSEGGF